MTLTIILVCCLPVALIFIVIFAIGTASSRTYRNARRAYADLRPYLNDVSQQVSRVQTMTMNFSDRGQNLSKTVEEIGGRWAFIAETISETTNSPVIKLADFAGKFAGRD